MGWDGVAWDGVGDDGWHGRLASFRASFAGRRKRQAKAELAGKGREAYFSSQAATRKAASDDGQKAQPAAFPPQTSLTNAGDRGEEERREEKPAQSTHYTRNRAARPAFLQGRSSGVRNSVCEEALRSRIGKQRGHIE